MPNYSWLLKYAPKSFRSEHFISPDEVRDQLIEITEGRWRENILLSGTVGTGKTSVGNLLMKHSVSSVLIDVPQYRASKNWQHGGQGWRMMMEAGGLDQFFLESREKRGRKIKRLVVLEEFDVVQDQGYFKTLLDAREDTICVLTTNWFNKIDESIVSRCVHLPFGRENELWMNYEEDKPAGVRGQIERDIRQLIRRMLFSELKKSARETIETKEVATFFKNIISQKYPSIRDILTNVRKYVVNKELKIPARLMKQL